MINPELVQILACPACADRPPVRLSADGEFLVCSQCGRRYPIREDIPVMLVDEALSSDGQDATSNPGTS
jgi:uncharacterized protein YbaR (Trm112 family)